MGIDRTKYRMLGVGAVDEWYCGLDIGQSVDPSAFAAIQHVVEPLDDWACNDEAKFWKRAKRERCS